MSHERDKPHVLIADDCKVWRHLVQRATKRNQLPLEVTFVTNGVEAVDYLNAQKAEGAQHLPELVILDLNMPLASGRDVLNIVAMDPVLSEIPFVVMSTSGFDDEVEQCRQLGAADFVVKPRDVNGFVEVMHSLIARWLIPAEAN